MVDLFFKKAVEFVLFNEGGFVDDPDDPGGATNFGITQGTLSQWRGEPASSTDVKMLTKDQAAVIYFERYWKPLSGPRMVQLPIATAVLDAGVLFGVSASAVTAQRALRANCFSQLEIDGFIGSFTLNALNSIEPREFLKSFVYMLHRRIDAVIEKRPKSVKYKAGWLTRVDRLSTLKNYGSENVQG